MSTITGQVSGKSKTGKKKVLKFSNSKKPKKLPAKQAAAFMKEFNKLLKKHGIPRA